MFVDIIFRLCALISHYPYDPKLSPASDFLAALNCGLLCDHALLSAAGSAQLQRDAAAVYPRVAENPRRTWRDLLPGSRQEAEFLVLIRNIAALELLVEPAACDPHRKVAPVAGFSADGKRTGVLVRAGSRDMRSKTDKLLPRGKYP